MKATFENYVAPIKSIPSACKCDYIMVSQWVGEGEEKC